MRDLRRHLVAERGVDKADIRFQGYRRRGRSEDQAAAEALAEQDAATDPGTRGH